MTISLINYTEAEHLPLLTSWLTNEKLMRGWGMPPFWDHKVSEWASETNKVILMIKDDDTGEIVGMVNFYDWDKDKQTAEWGILIDPKFQNKGYGKQAIKLSQDYAFNNLGLTRINIYVDDDNAVSKHLVETNGFVFDKHDDNKNRNLYYITPQ